MKKSWHRFETLRPDQLRSTLEESSVIYWPLGLLEHHGWHLPVGFDGLKAEKLCIRFAEQTGGLVLPVMWWGGDGGHEHFAWTFYQDVNAVEKILTDTVDKLARNGCKVIVILAGHYPWDPILDRVLPGVQNTHEEVLILYGTEQSLGKRLGLRIKGDHAARWETTYGLTLFPELVDMKALTPHKSANWPDPDKRPDPNLYPKLSLDPNDPLFSIHGEDPRETASAIEGEKILTELCNAVTAKVQSHLEL